MSRWRKRRLDLQEKRTELERTEQKIIDLAIRRARLDAEIALYVLQPRQGGHHARGA